MDRDWAECHSPVLKSLYVAETAARVMFEAAQSARPNEAGGVLLGVLTGKELWVTHALGVPSVEVGPNHYVLPKGVTPPLVQWIRLVDDRLGYVGDWHVHPSDIGASPQDRATMRTVAAQIKTDDAVPCLLIVRPRGSANVLDGYYATVSRVSKALTILTGDIGPPGQ